MLGFPHHVTQRGNNGQDVFLTPADRRTYLRFLRGRSEKCGVPILGYCLMTNHVHLIAVPRTERALSDMVGRTHFLYTQYFNRLHERTGHLWQNRFYSCPMDESHLWTALCYIERNPVRAGSVSEPWQYAWSSAAVHCGETPRDSHWPDLDAWSRMWTPAQWREVLRRPGDSAQTEQVRHSTRTGRPLANDAFLKEVEHVLGRSLPSSAPNK